MTDDLMATCAEIEEEILRVLNEKFDWNLAVAELAIQRILARSMTVKLKGTGAEVS